MAKDCPSLEELQRLLADSQAMLVKIRKHMAQIRAEINKVKKQNARSSPPKT
jgi:uncharacterized coiled-coil protein SlyX